MNTDPRRQITRRRLTAAMLLSAASVPAVRANAFPSQPVKLIVPFATGGMVDTVGRIFSNGLGAALGTPVIVENRPGAGSAVGASAVAKATGDGHTLLLIGIPLATNEALYEKLPYRQSDLTAIALTAAVPMMLVTGSASPYSTVAELLVQARKKGRPLTYASAGAGTLGHLGMHLFGELSKIELIHVPYKGGAPAMTDVIGGQVDLFLDTPINSGPMVKAGKLKPLLVTAPRRLAVFPDVQTAAEAGLKDFNFHAWLAFMAPAGTPRAVVTRLNAELNRLQATDEGRRRLASVGADPIVMTPADAARFIAEETARWSALVRRTGARAE